MSDSPKPRFSVLDELVIGQAFPVIGRPDLADRFDQIEALDANGECQHGRLPHDRTPPCGCWAQEPKPDLIPEWVLADARDLRAQGVTVRRIARIIQPATGCPDVPSCAKLLKLKLENEHKAPR